MAQLPAKEMTPEAKAYVEAARQNSSQKGWNLPIVKPVDPEAEINARMANQANTLHPAVAPSVPQAGSAEARQTINPATGLPYSVQDTQPASPEEAQRQEEARAGQSRHLQGQGLPEVFL